MEPVLVQLAADFDGPARRQRRPPKDAAAPPQIDASPTRAAHWPNAIPWPPSVRNGWLNAPDLARELGVDTRTIKTQVLGDPDKGEPDQPFVSRVSDRVLLIHRESYYAWVRAGRPAPPKKAN